jgi:hypothetical protein
MSLGALVERLCRARELNGTWPWRISTPTRGAAPEPGSTSLFQIFDSVPAALEGLVGAGSEAVAALAA